ncbi:hypothetical protein SNE40_008002 [Patella caerulea]|uniref:G-protein coupled receptors family 1 profile domain-containing protein n=1 Tax=Patella caerulea TaxID=87958 RepID=A0AAN8JYT6_PATCE
MENSSYCVNDSGQVTNNAMDAGFVVSTICLGILVSVVVAGNILVVAAVLTTRKLRTVTNIFIVNLACADLLLGIFVLPFSAALEVLDSWIFGTIWCHVWLATDVLLCTASILNLCCISFDRYVAITRPMKYPGIMSSKRGKLLVAATWIVSFLICLPPLIGWNDGNETTETKRSEVNISQLVIKDYNSNFSRHIIVDTYMLDKNANVSANGEFQSVPPVPCLVVPVTCELINTRGYRIYSALGSYFIPMFVMVFFYIRIYRAAVKTISAYQKGVLTTKSNGETMNNKVTLRVHRGGSYINHNKKTNRPGSSSSSPNSSERRKSEETSLSRSNSKKYELGTPLINTNYQRRFRSRYHTYNKNSECPTCETTIKIIHDPPPEEGRHDRQLSLTSANTPRDKDQNCKKCYHSNDRLKPTNGVRIKFSGNKPTRTASALQKTGKHMKTQMRKFNREQKAAKTLAIIVGAFIVCWLPFFSIYLIGAFCDNCIPAVLFSVFFWLGYCNSAINPCVYALFARDFRFAFKKLLTCGIRRQPCKSASDLASMNLNHIQSLNNFSDNSSES